MGKKQVHLSAQPVRPVHCEVLQRVGLKREIETTFTGANTMRTGLSNAELADVSARSRFVHPCRAVLSVIYTEIRCSWNGSACQSHFLIFSGTVENVNIAVSVLENRWAALLTMQIDYIYFTFMDVSTHYFIIFMFIYLLNKLDKERAQGKHSQCGTVKWDYGSKE